MYDQIVKVPSYTALMATGGVLGQLAIDTSNLSTYQHNGTTWMPLARTGVKSSTVAINGMATGATPIYTLENNPLNFVPVDVVLTMASVTGSVTTQPVISVGSNGTAYNNIATGSLLTTILSTLSVGSGAPVKASYAPKLAALTTIYANVTTAAIGPSILTYNVDIVGFYKA